MLSHEALYVEYTSLISCLIQTFSSQKNLNPITYSVSVTVILINIIPKNDLLKKLVVNLGNG